MQLRLRISRWRHPWNGGTLNPVTSVLVTKRKDRNRDMRGCQMKMKLETEEVREAGDWGTPPEARREACTRFSCRRNQVCLTSIFWTSGLQKYKRINFHCFKPPTLWWFVTVVLNDIPLNLTILIIVFIGKSYFLFCEISVLFFFPFSIILFPIDTHELSIC